ncbi:hypothetical protein VTL71DRAFT_15490 [Oculimacula yallundae]|uniref:Uncharacterized protein n=1 Tax=Oculimacula yallundae TaxID=86028 RepID=A0ABR4CI30_9HELO
MKISREFWSNQVKSFSSYNSPFSIYISQSTPNTLRYKSINMPAGPDETDNHPTGAATEVTAKNASSKTESNASTHPLHDQGEKKGDKVEFIHDANPGPAQPKEFNVQQEGTKEERAAKAKELNK